MRKVTEIVNEISKDLSELRNTSEIKGSLKLSQTVQGLRLDFADFTYLLIKEQKRNEKTDTQICL
nr:MAG TPA: hypothetical protein [Caudoviricetes sp.]